MWDLDKSAAADKDAVEMKIVLVTRPDAPSLQKQILYILFFFLTEELLVKVPKSQTAKCSPLWLCETLLTSPMGMGQHYIAQVLHQSSVLLSGSNKHINLGTIMPEHGSIFYNQVREGDGLLVTTEIQRMDELNASHTLYPNKAPVQSPDSCNPLSPWHAVNK